MIDKNLLQICGVQCVPAHMKARDKEFEEGIKKDQQDDTTAPGLIIATHI